MIQMCNTALKGTHCPELQSTQSKAKTEFSPKLKLCSVPLWLKYSNEQSYALPI